jgi:hypothetical protein
MFYFAARARLNVAAAGATTMAVASASVERQARSFTRHCRT